MKKHNDDLPIVSNHCGCMSWDIYRLPSGMFRVRSYNCTGEYSAPMIFATIDLATKYINQEMAEMCGGGD